MKKIFIASHCMEIGGAERSLLGLLNAIDFNKYEVDLFLYRHTGEFLNMIPKEVNLLPENKKYSTLARPMINVLKEGHIEMVASRVCGKICSYIYDKKNKSAKPSLVSIEYSHKFTRRLLPKINYNCDYDLAISFLTPHYIVKEKVKAKKKIAWIHTDYSMININVKSETKMWSSFNHIVAISESVGKEFIKVFRSLKEKVIIIENILSVDFLLQQADIVDISYELPEVEGVINLCSVGRFSEQKNFDNIPAICKKMVYSNCNIRWYIIGYGSEEHIIRQKINENGMQHNVIILGKKVNPYPYIKACDIYVQPSRYEGKAVTVREAQILCKPVVITNFETSKSQLVDGFDGVVVPMDNERCAEGIKDLIKNKELIQILIENCRKSNYSNENEINKIYELI